MKLSFNKSLTSVIKPYNSKNSTSNFSKDISPIFIPKKINKAILNSFSSNKKLIKIKSLNKLDISRQPKSLFLQFNTNKLSYSSKSSKNINNRSNNTKYNSTTFSERKVYSTKNLYKRKITFEEKNLIKKTKDIIIHSSSEKTKYDKLNDHRGSATLAYLFYKENIPKKRTKLNFQRINYPLNELMKLNPYHYLPNGIKDSINKFKKINQKYNYPNLGRTIKTTSGNSLKALKTNSILLRKSDKKIHLLKKLLKIYKFTHDDFHFYIKWEGINHLWQKHTKIINSLIKNFYAYKWFLDENELIDFEKLNEFIKLIFQIEKFNINFKCFFEDIFDLFSKDKINTNLKKLFSTFIITNNHINYNDKIKFLVDIWEKSNENQINVKNIIYYIQNNLFYKSDFDIVYSFFHQMNLKYIKKENVYNYFIENEKLKKVFERNFNVDYKKIEDEYNQIVFNHCRKNIKELIMRMNYFGQKILSPNKINNLEEILENIERTKENIKKVKELLISENYNSS